MRKKKNDEIVKQRELLLQKMARAISSNAQRSVNNLWTSPAELDLNASILDRIYETSSLVRMVVDTKIKTMVNLDWDIVAKAGAEINEADIQAVKSFIEMPNDADDYYSFMTKLLRDLFVYDSMACEIVKENGAIKELVPIDGSTISPSYDDKGRLIKYIQKPRTGTTYPEFALDEMIYANEHPSTSKLRGHSAIASLITEISADIYIMNYNANFFRDGFLFNKILLLSGIGDDQLEKIDANMESKNNKRMMTLDIPDGDKAKLLDLGFNLKDMEFKEMSEWLLKRICGVYQVTVNDVLELYQSATRASAEVQKQIADSKTYRPIVSLLESQINRKVIRHLNPNLQFKIAPERMTEREKAEVLGLKWKAGIPLNTALKEVGREPIVAEITIGDKTINPYDYPVGSELGYTRMLNAMAEVPLEEGGIFELEKAIRRRRQVSKSKLRLAMRKYNRDEEDEKIQNELLDIFNDFRAKLKSVIRASTPPFDIVQDENVLAKSDKYQRWGEEVVRVALRESDFKNKFDEKMKKRFARLFKDVGDHLLGQIGVSFDKDFWDRQASRYHKARFYDGGVLFNIEETQRKQIGKIIADSYQEGLTLKDWWLKLEKEIDDAEIWQAERIARTENMLASTDGMMDTWRDLGVQKWELIESPRACGLCKAIANGGTPLKYDGKFSGRLAGITFKGNPYTDEDRKELSAKTGFSDWLPHPNCADAWVPFIESDEEFAEVRANAEKLRAAQK